MDVGAHLRSSREAQGISLALLAARTRVQPRILTAIETNDLGGIPPKPYGRGFVRAYARELGLDPDRVVHDYFGQFPSAPVTVAATPPPLEKGRQHRRVRAGGSCDSDRSRYRGCALAECANGEPAAAHSSRWNNGRFTCADQPASPERCSVDPVDAADAASGGRSAHARHPCGTRQLGDGERGWHARHLSDPPGRLRTHTQRVARDRSSRR